MNVYDAYGLWSHIDYRMVVSCVADQTSCELCETNLFSFMHYSINNNKQRYPGHITTIITVGL